MAEEAVMCVRCGVARGQGYNYCHRCGKPLQPQATVCMNCGVPTSEAETVYTYYKGKSRVAAGILAIFFGSFGVHNFYLKYTGKAVTQLVLTLVGIITSCLGVGVFLVLGMGIWAFVEGILILIGNIDKDGEGYPLSD
jgi:TM2 domain-containing membrane protein YozV